MSTADTALSISIKMAPGPEHRQEPVAPDKLAENSHVDDASDTEANVNSSVIAGETADSQIASVENVLTSTDACQDQPDQTAPTSISSDNKQEEPATLSTLNEGELRALLDEAITYKRPKDREGKSSLFKELLQEAEADETEEGHRVVPHLRLPGSSRRRHKRDSVSERLTHGGSLQNLAQPLASEFDSSFAYLTSGSSHTYGGSRRKNKKFTGPSVSARQREGGSLPSNVNASHSLASLVNLDLNFDKKKGFCEERTIYDWTNKEKSKSLDKPSYTNIKKEEKEKDRKEIKKDSGVSESELEVREKRISKGKHSTNEMHEPDNPPPEYKSDYMVIDLGDAEVGAISERNVGSTVSGVQRPQSLDTEDDEGTEMKIIEPGRPQYISRTTFDITQTPVDTTIDFSLRDDNGKQDKSKISVNGIKVTGPLSFQTFNTVKCGIGGTTNSSSTSQSKIGPSLCPMMSASLQTQNITMEGSRYAGHTGSAAEKKSLDENGNAVQNYNGERKKIRRKHTQDLNVVTYISESVVGHHYEDDLDRLINYIENKESKSKKGKPTNTVRVKTSSGGKSRSREKDTKSNSLEEISKTKLEDLTTEKSISSSGASSLSSQHGTINVPLRRAKQRSTGDTTMDNRGDRRSWGTEEESEHETEFLVVTKKKKSKKQRRSSSGSRAQNLATSGSYLQNTRGFSTEYRTPLSPELRRKSASSMPPSDKSDSSDSDSVHSLPVTSNTSKHNLSKVATSTGSTPQASYADIARMATINMTHSSVLNISTIGPTMITTTSWPSVPPKTPSEPDKMPQDYYPSLDELQQSDRKIRQHSFAHSNNILSFNFDKTSSTTASKAKNLSERKKAEAQEEAINKNIQVIKYVQEIEKIQQANKLSNMNNQTINPSDVITTNQVTSKLNNTMLNNNPMEIENSNPSVVTANKDAIVSTRSNNPRSRRTYIQNNQNMPNLTQYEEQHFKRSAHAHQDDKKLNTSDAAAHQIHVEGKSNPGTLSVDESELQRARTQSNPKPAEEVQNNETESAKLSKSDKLNKAVREPQSMNLKPDSGKIGSLQSQNIMSDQSEEGEIKKTKQQHALSDKENTVKSNVDSQAPSKQKTPRPAVILLDETASDTSKDGELPTELTFGFEINEQLLLSDEAVVGESPTANQIFQSVVPPLINKPPTNFDRYPPMFEKHIRCDKFPTNFMQPSNAHASQQPVHPVMMQSLPCMPYPPRFPPPTCLPPPQAPPAVVPEKYHQPREDFSMLYVAPEEDVNIQTYNHDKIVSFVGLAWDAVMREMPITATSGRIRFYSGQ